ncbi:MAG TPA: hypothetical protein EYG73_07640 [Arcobacter sp.]|nr:hypothetical protein [Arcobacter sp.]
MENIIELLLTCKNKNLEENEIIEFENDINKFSSQARENISDENYELFLNTLGYAYRLENSAQRLYYTFNEAVSAVDIAKLTNDIDSLENYSFIYSMALNTCILDYLKKDINDDEIQEAITVYKKLEEQKSKENKKYHAYQ